MSIKSYVLNPGIIFISYWLCIIVFGSLPILGYHPFTSRFIVFILISTVSFWFGAYFGKSFSRYLGNFKGILFKTNDKLIFYLYFGCMLLTIVLIVIDHYSLVGANWWTVAGIGKYRLMVTELGYPSLYKYFSILNYFFYTSIPFLILKKRLFNGLSTAFFLVLIGLFVYMSSSRSSIFLITLVGVWFYIFNEPVFRIRYIFIVGLFLVLAFFGVGSLSGKGSLESIWKYFLSPSHALDVLLNDPNFFGGDVQLWLLRPIHGLLLQVEFIQPSDSTILPYVFTPYPVNVYTFFSPYLLDLGYEFTILAVFFIGTLTGFFVSKGRLQNDPRDRLLGSVLFSLLILGSFYDYYLSSAFPIYIYVLSIFFFPRSYRI
jgi:oligosaccharide repeat unit polymerase